MAALKVTKTFSVPVASAVAELSDGSLAVFCRGQHGPFRIDKHGRVTQWALIGSSWNGQDALAAVSDMESGAVYVSDRTAVYKIQLNGQTKLLAGSPFQDGYQDGNTMDARFSNVHGLCMMNGNLIASDSLNNKLRLINLSTGSVSTLASGTPGCTMTGIAYDRFKDSIIAADHTGHSIVQFINGISGYCTSVYAGTGASGNMDGNLTSAQFNSPYSVMLDKAGTILVADYGNQSIRCISPSAAEVSTVKLAGSSGKPVSLHGPNHGCILSNGRVALTDISSGKLYIFESEGLLAASLPSTPSTKNSMITNASQNSKPTSIGLGAWQMQQNMCMIDVWFKVDGEEIPAHKVILASRSEYFEAMLSAASTRSKDGREIEITDTTPDAFKAVLRYIYLDDLDVPEEILTDVVLLAKRCLLLQLVQSCIGKLKKAFNPKNAVKICVWAYVHNIDEVKAYAVQGVAQIRKSLRADDEAALKQHPDLLYEVLKYA